MTTNLDFVPTRPGEWAVSARCETRDTRTGKWTARTGQGAAVRSMGIVMSDLGKLGRFVLFQDGDLSVNVKACASGQADIGTGD